MIHSLYIPKHFRNNISYIERMADANGRSVNSQIIFMLKRDIDEHRRFQDTRITEYETEIIRNMGCSDSEVVCKICLARRSDVDSNGYLIHDLGCPDNKRGPILE